MNKVLIGRMIASAILFIGVAKAQPQIDLAAIQQKYQGQSAIFLNNEQVYYCNVTKDKIDIKGDHTIQVLYLDDKSTSANERTISYAPDFYVIENLEAATYVREGDKYKKLKVTSFKDQDNTNGSSFYDGVKCRKFFFSGLSQNAIAETKFTYRYLDPSHLGAFYFMRGIPCLKSSFTVVVDKNVSIEYRFFGDSSKISFSQTTKGNNTYYKWELLDAKELKSYNDAVDDRYEEPHVYVYIKDYTTKSKGKVPMFGTVEKLYKHDYKYIASVNQQAAEPLLKAVVDSIVKQSAGNETEILRGTYSWVQQNIKYIAFENGLGGQIPREANDVFTKKYGDCKDLASLITFMLKNAGIKSYLTWVGTRDLPYSYNDLPLGYASNHMIAAVYYQGKWVFIDGTAKHIPFGIPSAFTQGKEGLIAISPDSFVVEVIPIMPTTYSYSNTVMDMKLDGTTLKGNGKLELAGYNHSSWAGSLYYVGTDKLEKSMKDMLSVGNNKFEVTSISYSNLYNNDSSLSFQYGFNLPSYVKFIDNDIYINMHLRKTYSDYKIDTTGNRKIARDFSYTWLDEATFSIDIPEGYKVKKMPANTSHIGQHLSYAFTYTLQNNKIIFHKSSSYDKLTVDAPEFEEWNKQIDEIIKRYRDLIILTKK
jgi:hypothetical protein